MKNPNPAAKIMEIQQHPFFHETPDSLREQLTKDCSLLTFPAGERIFDEGDQADSFYLILDGVVGFQKRVPREERHRTISRAKAGQSFGEIGVITGEPRSLRAVVIEEARLAKISSEALHTYLSTVPGPLRNLVTSVVAHLEQTTRQYLEVLLHQEKMHTIGSMMNSILNSLQNPFSIIGMGAHLLSANHPEPQSQKLCETIAAQVQIMNAKVSEFRDFAQGVRQLRKEPVHLPSLIEQLKQLNYHYFRHENLSLTTSVPHVFLLGQEDKLLNLLQHLVENSIAAIGAAEGHIRIDAELITDHLLVLRVADDGPGVPETIRSQLFEPFVSHGDNRGAGIGTSLAKAIVEAHGGTIRFTTETGQGTTFHIKLPCFRKEEEARAKADAEKTIQQPDDTPDN